MAWREPLNRIQDPIPTDLSSGLDPFSPRLFILSLGLGLRPHPKHVSPPPPREGMHCYSYDGCDSDSPGSGPLSESDSEASGTQSQRSLVILLDDDEEDDGFEQPVHPVPSHRPKRPLPRSFSRSYHPPVKEEKVQATDIPRPEVYHTINCTPGLRDKSLEVRISLKTTISQLKSRCRNSGWNVISRARSRRGDLPNRSAAE